MQFLAKIISKIISFPTSLNKEMIVAFFLIFSPILYPKTANAGLFSFFSNLTGDKVSAKTVEIQSLPNSQNISILQATVNYDPNPNKLSEDIVMVSGNALVPEIGPSGTVSDIEQENTNSQISIYIVHENDTLSNIAKMFGVSVNTIVWANDLNRNLTIKEGQTLIILPISGIRHTVKKGDSIKSIVFKYKADLNEVLQYNDLSLSSTINVGDIIIIPDAEPTIIDTPRIQLSRKISTNYVHDANGPYYPGYYLRPIDGGSKSQGLHGYNAVDLASSIGMPIHAAAAGTVIASMSNGSWNGGYGNYVIISHNNGTQTLYAHNLKNFVKVGDFVERGEMVARIGMTGKSTGPHVHFEIRGAKNPF